jgi:hypothetical protein
MVCRSRRRRGLTPRSRRGPTALRLAREAPWYMMRFAGQAQYRRSRLNSNVRPLNSPLPSPQAGAVQCQHPKPRAPSARFSLPSESGRRSKQLAAFETLARQPRRSALLAQTSVLCTVQCARSSDVRPSRIWLSLLRRMDYRLARSRRGCTGRARQSPSQFLQSKLVASASLMT